MNIGEGAWATCVCNLYDCGISSLVVGSVLLTSSNVVAVFSRKPVSLYQ